MTTTTAQPATVLTPAAGPLPEDDGGGLGLGMLFLVGVLPVLLLVLAFLPDHTAAAVGPAGRVIVNGRIAFAATAFAIWLGVLVTMALGGQA